MKTEYFALVLGFGLIAMLFITAGIWVAPFHTAFKLLFSAGIFAGLSIAVALLAPKDDKRRGPGRPRTRR